VSNSDLLLSSASSSSVDILAETYPDVDEDSLQEYLTARRELESIKAQLAEKEQLNLGSYSRNPNGY